MCCTRPFRTVIVAVAAVIFAGLGCDSRKKDSPGAGPVTPSDNGPTHVFKATPGTPPKLAFVINNPSPFWDGAAAGVKKFEGETNVHVDFKIPQNGQVAEQNAILENLLSQGYNGIAISVIAPADQVSELNRACEKTNVICHDSDAPKSHRLLYIGTNNVEAGKVLGNEIVKLMPSGGKIAVFVGTFSADNARERLNGIESAIAGHNIEVKVKKEDNGDRTAARSNVEKVITAYPEVTMMVGLWSYNGPQIASAVEASGKQGTIKAAVFDDETGTLDAIEKGSITSTVVQKPFQFGYLSSKLLYALATRGEEALKDPLIKDGKIDTGVEVINSQNVKDYRAGLADLTKKK